MTKNRIMHSAISKWTAKIIVIAIAITALSHQAQGVTDPELVEMFKADLTHQEENKRLRAVEVLDTLIKEDRIGTQGPEVATALAKAMLIKGPLFKERLKIALFDLGEDAVQPLVDLLKIEGRLIQRGPTRDVQGTSPFVLAGHAIEVLEKMDPKIRREKILPALRALASGGNFPGISVGEAKEMVQLALIKLDPNAKPYSPEPVNQGHLEGTLRSHGWEGWFYYAKMRPDKQLIPMIVKYMKDDEAGRPYYYGMVLDRLGGPDAIPALIQLLSEKDWYSRYAATAGLEMLGGKAKAALPELSKRLTDEREDIEVRVGAARAITSIERTDLPLTLRTTIPDVESRIVKSTREKSRAYRQEFMKLKGSQFEVNERNQWSGSAACVYALATDQHVDEVNTWITNWIETGKKAARNPFSDLASKMNLVRVLVMFHSKSRFTPGRLKPAVEARLKETFFNIMDQQYMQNRLVMSSKDIHPERAYEMNRHANGPIRWDVFQYLTLSVLKDDPAYKNKKFKQGDSVKGRYDLFSTFLKNHLKDWSLWGLWNEFGSSYISRTFSAYFNLVDLAPDPAVRKLAKMWIDLTMIEHEQIAISGIRGGSKSRPKAGGLGNSFYCAGEIAMLFGERGVIVSGNGQIPNNAYEVPDAAILLRKLGKPVTTYEIANRHPGEIAVYKGKEDPEIIRDVMNGNLIGSADAVRLSHAVNYAYSTPDYVIGCAMINPNRLYGNYVGGRWSGVIFRDLSVVEFPAYTGEKWNVQDKNVIICQRIPETTYHNWSRVAFSARLEKVERDGWVFAKTRNGVGYTAVKVVNGGYVWDGAGKNTLYLFKDEFSPIIMQVGTSEEYGSFEKFQKAILKAPLKLERLPNSGRIVKVEYKGPKSKRLEFFLRTDPYILPKIDGKTISLDPEYNYNSPYMKSKTGSDIVTVRYGRRRWDYDFAKKTINTKN